VRFYHIDSTTSAQSKLPGIKPGLYDPSKAAKLIQPHIAPVTTTRVGRNPATGEIVPAVLIRALAPDSGQIASEALFCPNAALRADETEEAEFSLGTDLELAIDRDSGTLIRT
jgi:hypothetical protein